MRARIWLAVAALLAACGDDGGEGAADAGSGSGTPLSNLFAGFGSSTGSGNPPEVAPAAATDAGGRPGGEPDAGADTLRDGATPEPDPQPEEPSAPPTAADDYCAQICAHVFHCMPAACPNFQRLTPVEVDNLIRGCREDCAGATREVYEQYASHTCEEISREVRRTVPEVEGFCSLVPVSDARCASFCAHVRGCGWAASDAQCASTCLYADAVECILDNGCDFAACQPR